LKNKSLLLFVAASRVCITGLGLNARCGFFSLGDDMLTSKSRGVAFADRSDSGEERGGVYGE
jgi:hypothetical protein